MPTTFKTHPIELAEILKHCGDGRIQLPEFQRSWVWDDDRIRSLIASISQAFPIGALMTLETGGDVELETRTIEGATPKSKDPKAESLLLDGQQRMTSLYQTLCRRQVVHTITTRQVKVRRWYYIDIQKALDANVAREDAIVGVSEDRKIKSNFGRKVEQDLSTPEGEFENAMFPLHCVFEWDEWNDGFEDYWDSRRSYAGIWVTPVIRRRSVLASG